MTVVIKNMKLSAYLTTLATFDVEVDGWTINCCVIAESIDGGRPMVLPPIVKFGNKRRSVKFPGDIYFEVIEAAMSAYREARQAERAPKALGPGQSVVLESGQSEALAIAGM